jgi:hypothetical protein
MLLCPFLITIVNYFLHKDSEQKFVNGMHACLLVFLPRAVPQNKANIVLFK